MLQARFLRWATVMKYIGLGGHAFEIFLAILGKLAKRKLSIFRTWDKVIPENMFIYRGYIGVVRYI